MGNACLDMRAAAHDIKALCSPFTVQVLGLQRPLGTRGQGGKDRTEGAQGTVRGHLERTPRLKTQDLST